VSGPERVAGRIVERPCRNPYCPHDRPIIPAFEVAGIVLAGLCPGCTDEENERERLELRRSRVEELMGRVRLGERVKSWSLETYPAVDKRGRNAFKAGVKWLEGYRRGERGGLLILGPVGVGKTGLAWGLAKELIQVDLVDANMVVFRDLLAEMRDGIREGRRRDKRLRSTPVLFLDDLGAERPTDWTRDELATLIEHRWERGLTTGITSNYPPAALMERLGHDDPVVGKRIVSRLTEGATQIVIEGPDRRDEGRG
jgi:DNA replication protein DnaC